MKTGKMVIGAIVLLVGFWMLFALGNGFVRYLGGGIVTILGVLMLVSGYKKDPVKGRSQPFRPQNQPPKP